MHMSRQAVLATKLASLDCCSVRVARLRMLILPNYEFRNQLTLIFLCAQHVHLCEAVLLYWHSHQQQCLIILPHVQGKNCSRNATVAETEDVAIHCHIIHCHACVWQLCNQQLISREVGSHMHLCIWHLILVDQYHYTRGEF
jgi:hypothetical protein